MESFSSFAFEMFIRVDAVTQLSDIRDPEDRQNDILWSLRPIILFARCIGVELRLDACRDKKNKFFKRLLLGYCFSCLLVDAISQTNLVSFLYQSIIYKSTFSSNWNTFHPNWTAAASWNNIIDMANYSIHNFGSHLIFLLIIRNNWTNVVDSFLRFEFEVSFLSKLRKISILGIAYITILVVYASIFIAFDHWREGSTKERILVALNSTVPSVYPTTSLILFGISNYITSYIFNSLKQDLNTMNVSSTHIRSWKQRHILACQLVNSLNDCFGWTLFISTSYLFLAIINCSFYFFGEFVADPVEIVLATMNICHLSLITLSSDSIRKQAKGILGEILEIKLKLLDYENEQEMNWLMMQVAQSLPRASALGFFTVNKKLIPQVFGVTMTYFFIIYQFHSTENSVITNKN